MSPLRLLYPDCLWTSLAHTHIHTHSCQQTVNAYASHFLTIKPENANAVNYVLTLPCYRALITVYMGVGTIRGCDMFTTEAQTHSHTHTRHKSVQKNCRNNSVPKVKSKMIQNQHIQGLRKVFSQYFSTLFFTTMKGEEEKKCLQWAQQLCLIKGMKPGELYRDRSTEKNRGMLKKSLRGKRKKKDGRLQKRLNSTLIPQPPSFWKSNSILRKLLGD